MKIKSVKKLFLAAGLASAMAMPSSNALADDAATIFGLGSGTAVTYDDASGNYPVVTAILSQPGTFNGKTYSKWSFLAQDTSGSLDIYSSDPLPGSYTPTVGDAISVDGTYSPYNQVPEISPTGITVMSTGNSVPAIGVSTIPTLNQATLPQNVAGYLWELDNVTISGISDATFGTSNLGGTITDSSNNSMTLYYWASSYSAANVNLYGTVVPTGPVNMTGFVSVYSSNPEFIPVSITSVPEPASLTLFGIGGLLTLSLALRRRSA